MSSALAGDPFCSAFSVLISMNGLEGFATNIDSVSVLIVGFLYEMN